MPVPYCFDDCSFVVESKVGAFTSSCSVSLSQDCFDFWGIFCVSIQISKNFCSSCVKNAIDNLIRIALNL